MEMSRPRIAGWRLFVRPPSRHRCSRSQWHSCSAFGSRGDVRGCVMSFLRKQREAVARCLLIGTLAMPMATTAFAQDAAGVSGVPAGPGNANGVNGSVRDPSGIGNAGRVAPLPGPSVQPGVSGTPLTSTRPAVSQGSARARTAGLQGGRKARAAAVKENDQLLGRVTGICRGC